MKTFSILILAIAALPALARPIFEHEQPHISSLTRDRDNVRWGNVNTDVHLPRPLFFTRNVDNDLYTRDFDDELEARDFEEDLEARDFDDELEARQFDDELEVRDFDDELEARDFDHELEARGHHCPECKKAPTNRCIKNGHLEECDKHDKPVYNIPGNECVSCQAVREAEERRAKAEAEAAKKKKKKT